MVVVEWLGHACFRISHDDFSVVIDPFETGADIRYPPIDVKADLVLVTHDHYDHNNVRSIRGNPKIIKGEGEWSDPIPIRGVAASHGPSRGPVTIYRFEMGKLALCHLGDLGELVDEKLAERVRPVDILMVPVGGTYTIDGRQADDVIRALSPRLAIPMHYGNEYITFSLATVGDFTAGKKNVRRERTNKLNVTKDTLPSTTTIVVLACPK